MDSRLHWDDHLNMVDAKAAKSINTLSMLGGSTWGITTEDLRKVYVMIILSQILY
jgi:hypothetical protein